MEMADGRWQMLVLAGACCRDCCFCFEECCFCAQSTDRVLVTVRWIDAERRYVPGRSDLELEAAAWFVRL